MRLLPGRSSGEGGDDGRDAGRAQAHASARRVVGVARVIAGSGSWVPVHLAIVVGILLMLGGLVALDLSIGDGIAGTLARFGLWAAVGGVTIGLVLVILDGVAAHQLA